VEHPWLISAVGAQAPPCDTRGEIPRRTSLLAALASPDGGGQGRAPSGVAVDRSQRPRKISPGRWMRHCQRITSLHRWANDLRGGTGMQKSTTRIRTSHVGRLPPPKGWEDMPARRANAEVIDGGEIASHVVPAIAETVKKQVEIGIDCINDGEFWTARSLAHYAAHFTGLEARPVKFGEPPTTRHS